MWKESFVHSSSVTSTVTFKMQSFSVEVGSRGFHVYRDVNWTNLVVHQPVRVSIETNPTSKAYDPYCCKITIRRLDRIGVVTVGHIPRELSRYVYYFLNEGGSVTGTVSSVQHRVSPIPEGGLEIPIQMTFSHHAKPIIEKMKLFVETQITKMGQVFRMEEEEEDPDDETDDIVLENDGNSAPSMVNTDVAGTSNAKLIPPVIVIDDDDDDDEEAIQPSERTESIDDMEEECEEDIRERVRREIDEVLAAQMEKENSEEHTVLILE